MKPTHNESAPCHRPRHLQGRMDAFMQRRRAAKKLRAGLRATLDRMLEASGLEDTQENRKKVGAQLQSRIEKHFLIPTEEQEK